MISEVEAEWAGYAVVDPYRLVLISRLNVIVFGNLTDYGP